MESLEKKSKEEYIDYGLCAGVNIPAYEGFSSCFIEPHKFYDGKKHFKDSHSMCPECSAKYKNI